MLLWLAVVVVALSTKCEQESISGQVETHTECTLMSEEHQCNGRSVFYYETPSLDIYNYETSPLRLVDVRVEVLHFPLKVTCNVISTPNILVLNKKNKTAIHAAEFDTKIEVTLYSCVPLSRSRAAASFHVCQDSYNKCAGFI